MNNNNNKNSYNKLKNFIKTVEKDNAFMVNVYPKQNKTYKSKNSNCLRLITKLKSRGIA